MFVAEDSLLARSSCASPAPDWTKESRIETARIKPAFIVDAGKSKKTRHIRVAIVWSEKHNER